MNEHSKEIDSGSKTDPAAPTPADGADGVVRAGDATNAADLASADAQPGPFPEQRATTQRGADIGTSRVRTNDYVPARAGDGGGTPQWFGFALGALLVLAAVGAAFFLYSSDETDSSSLVARRAEPTALATATPVAAPEPTAAPATPTATPQPAAIAEPDTVFDRAAGSEQFSVLAGAITAVGLDGELQTRSPITVFAPTDAAFAKVDLSRFSESELQEVLVYHVLDGQYGSDDLSVGDSLETITGESIVINDGFVINNRSAIIDTDIEASNGVVHAIDTVLIPRAFGPTVGDLIDGDADQLTSLATAVESMGLGDALDGDGPITVFAPTNAAFDDAGSLLATTDDDQTTAVLAYHVVPGEYLAADLSVGQELTTVQGESLIITEGLTINDDASIEEADLLASNGVVHKIDTVLVPGTFRTEQALNELFALDPIQFETASARILAESEPVLDEAIATLTASPTGDVEIEGHTDSVGGEQSNQSLSQRRAESVREYLVAGGVEPDRLTAIGYGESRLKVDPEESAADRQQNRRIEFRVG